ncbi:hypothetical protein cyc_01564 [Cyclospora cayetanensis]|uniref:Uncharacterized protein n=1 Tax=Cyclospora cayetanensis TaxID=88456 RepID=A0A1D3CT88_9EIME|nr:hypothetical protein cyc_01564 [Cyclospora cayetanensis]
MTMHLLTVFQPISGAEANPATLAAAITPRVAAKAAAKSAAKSAPTMHATLPSSPAATAYAQSETSALTERASVLASSPLILPLTPRTTANRGFRCGASSPKQQQQMMTMQRQHGWKHKDCARDLRALPEGSEAPCQSGGPLFQVCLKSYPNEVEAKNTEPPAASLPAAAAVVAPTTTTLNSSTTLRLLQPPQQLLLPSTEASKPVLDWTPPSLCSGADPLQQHLDSKAVLLQREPSCIIHKVSKAGSTHHSLLPPESQQRQPLQCEDWVYNTALPKQQSCCWGCGRSIYSDAPSGALLCWPSQISSCHSGRCNSQTGKWCVEPLQDTALPASTNDCGHCVAAVSLEKSVPSPEEATSLRAVAAESATAAEEAGLLPDEGTRSSHSGNSSSDESSLCCCDNDPCDCSKELWLSEALGRAATREHNKSKQERRARLASSLLKGATRQTHEASEWQALTCPTDSSRNV